MSLSFRNCTITEYLDTEDAGGNAQTRITVRRRAVYTAFSDIRRLSPDGATPDRTGLVMIDDVDGFGVSWSLRSGDRIDIDGRHFIAKTVTEAVSPRTGRLHHIEATV